MIELWLKFKNANGDEKRVPVDKDMFVIGRHSSSDLSIVDGRLSRQHAKIERFGDIFVVSDCGSSNGTTVNNEELTEPVALKHQDRLNLGGVEIELELIGNQPGADNGNNATADAAANKSSIDASAEDALPHVNVTASDTSGDVGMPSSIFLIAPLLGIIILIFAGGLIYLIGGKKQTDIVSSGNDFQYSTDDDDDPNDDIPTNKKSDLNSSTDTKPTDPGNSSNTIVTDRPGNSSNQPKQNLPETVKIEQHGAAFLRRIAQNDPRAFLTSEQAQRLSPKIKQFSGSSAVAANIDSARKNASQIRSLAAARNLKPQFLAVAAIAKLGNTRGDVLQAAAGMADTLDKLSTQVGNELAEDALLLIAAYDQGAAGDFMKMRNMLQELANQTSESSRTVRTIWFLQKNGKITQAEFDRALTFLAIGTIAQNPKEFGVNTEALML